jgi:hypothetical protein
MNNKGCPHVFGTIKEKLLARRKKVKGRLRTLCWEWTGTQDNHGYGQLRAEGRMQRVHRLAYREWIGPIPIELQIDHICSNRLCWRPIHIEAVTSRENTLRSPSSWATRTHCKQGHEFTELNTKWETISRNGYKSTYRRCLLCRRAATKRYKEKKKYGGDLSSI